MTLANALLSIVGATMAVSALGMLWYSPLLFGTLWMAYKNKTPKQISEEGGVAAALVASIIGHALGMITLYYVVERFVIVHTIFEALTLSLLLGCLIFTSQIAHAAYNKVPVGMFLIDHTYDIAVMVLGALVIGLVTGA